MGKSVPPVSSRSRTSTFVRATMAFLSCMTPLAASVKQTFNFPPSGRATEAEVPSSSGRFHPMPKM